MYINGSWLQVESTFPTHNPASGELLGEVADGSANHADQAIEAAHEALPKWSQETAYTRSCSDVFSVKIFLRF